MKRNFYLLFSLLFLLAGCEKYEPAIPLDSDEWEQATLKGEFSVSDTQKVRFSKGNLQYQASTDTWRFAENQYDIIGLTNDSASATYSGWIDLFGWGTSGWKSKAKAYLPWDNSTEPDDYYPGNKMKNDLTGDYEKADWGIYNSISNGGKAQGIWRTLTVDEQKYLFNQRDNASGLRCKATVVGNIGLLLMPDNWQDPGIPLNREGGPWDNVLDTTQWEMLEQTGVVFLPAAGVKINKETDDVNLNCRYWTSTHMDEWSAYALYVEAGGEINPESSTIRSYGASVRLVRKD